MTGSKDRTMETQMSQAQRPKYTLIDADTHITEPADVWTSRVPSRWKDRVPQVRWDDASQEECWFLEDQKLSPVGMTAMAGWPEKFPQHPPTFEASHAGAYDASARLRYMDEIGCWAQVLYPNVGGFGNQFFLRIPDEELKLACVRAYNDFQIDWISPDPRRFVPIMATPFWDVKAAAAEIQRCAARGHKGVLFTAGPRMSVCRSASTSAAAMTSSSRPSGSKRWAWHLPTRWPRARSS
jgi:predicted TIM-barrel fold metal-dependent hydrolase